MEPLSRACLAMVGMVGEPSKGGFYGGRLGAPFCVKGMAGTLRLMNVWPDQQMLMVVRMVSVGGKG